MRGTHGATVATAVLKAWKRLDVPSLVNVGEWRIWLSWLRRRPDMRAATAAQAVPAWIARPGLRLTITRRVTDETWVRLKQARVPHGASNEEARAIVRLAMTEARMVYRRLTRRKRWDRRYGQRSEQKEAR